MDSCNTVKLSVIKNKTLSLNASGVVQIGGGSSNVFWGNIRGLIENQTDLVEYVEQNGGKINSISINGEEQQIDENKNVDIQLPTTLAVTDQNNNFTAPQTFNGDITINGNITQNGETYETHAEQVYTKNDKITLRDGSTGGLGAEETTGLIAKNYDGEHDGELVFDKDGTARVGDVGDTQPLATRSEVKDLIEGQLMTWDSTQQKLVGSDKDDVVTDGLINNSNTLTSEQKTQVLEWLGITGMSQSEWNGFSNYVDGQYYFVWED